MIIKYKILLRGISACVLTTALITPTYAQFSTENLEYSLLKSTIGAETGIEYDTNIFRSPTNEENDLITTFTPQIKIESDMPEHSVAFLGRAEVGHYLNNNENDYIDFLTRLNADYDLAKNHVLSVMAQYRYDHVGIGSFVDEPDIELEEPVTFHQFNGLAQYQGKTDLVHYGAGVQAALYNYNNVDRQNGDINIQDDRDRNEYQIQGNLGYEFIPQQQVYVATSYSERIHDEMIDSSAISSRDSSDYRTGLGVKNDKDDTNFHYNVLFGYLHRNYDANRLPDISGIDIIAESTLKITDQDRVKISIDRDIRDSYSNNNSGYIQTSLALQYTRKIKPDLTAKAQLRYRNNNFETIDNASSFDREDNVFDIGGGLSYQIKEDLFANADYSYRNRNSNEDRAEYDAHQIGLSLSYKF